MKEMQYIVPVPGPDFFGDIIGRVLSKILDFTLFLE